MFVLKSLEGLIVYIILVCISSEEAPASYWVGASLNQNGGWKWEDGTVFNITGKDDKCCCFLHKKTNFVVKDDLSFLSVECL